MGPESTYATPWSHARPNHASEAPRQALFLSSKKCPVIPVLSPFYVYYFTFFFFQAEDGIRDLTVTGVQTCALPIYTIIASFLAAGALSALYYADRLNQLPIGVIGIAVGTVLLPEMASRIAAGDEAGARHAQNRAIELTLLLSIPCLVAFLLLPDLIMRALFMRGKFTAADAAAAGATLAAYALGLLPFVLIRSVTATFLARGDTATPMKASLTAVGINVGFKAALFYFTSLAQVGLALATSIGGWLHLRLVILVAPPRRHVAFHPPPPRPA